jgi:hypothetical protein
MSNVITCRDGKKRKIIAELIAAVQECDANKDEKRTIAG